MRGLVPEAVKRDLFTESGPCKWTNWCLRLGGVNAHYTDKYALALSLKSFTVDRGSVCALCLQLALHVKTFLLDTDSHKIWYLQHTHIQYTNLDSTTGPRHFHLSQRLFDIYSSGFTNLRLKILRILTNGWALYWNYIKDRISCGPAGPHIFLFCRCITASLEPCILV